MNEKDDIQLDMTQHHSAFSPPDTFNTQAVDHLVEMQSKMLYIHSPETAALFIY